MNSYVKKNNAFFVAASLLIGLSMPKNANAETLTVAGIPNGWQPIMTQTTPSAATVLTAKDNATNAFVPCANAGVTCVDAHGNPLSWLAVGNGYPWMHANGPADKAGMRYNVTEKTKIEFYATIGGSKGWEPSGKGIISLWLNDQKLTLRNLATNTDCTDCAINDNNVAVQFYGAPVDVKVGDKITLMLAPPADGNTAHGSTYTGLAVEKVPVIEPPVTPKPVSMMGGEALLFLAGGLVALVARRFRGNNQSLNNG